MCFKVQMEHNTEQKQKTIGECSACACGELKKGHRINQRHVSRIWQNTTKKKNLQKSKKTEKDR